MKQKRLTKQQVRALEWYVLYHAQLSGNEGIEHVLMLVESKSYFMAIEIVRIVNDLQITYEGLYYLPNAPKSPPKNVGELYLAVSNKSTESPPGNSHS